MAGLPQGVFAYVYAGQAGIGIGHFRIVEDRIEGRDVGKASFAGTIKSAPSGSGFVINGSFRVPAGTELVSGASAQEVTREYPDFTAFLPEDFDDGRPFPWMNGSGPVNVMCSRAEDHQISLLDRAMQVVRGEDG